MKVKVYDKEGAEKEQIEVSDAISVYAENAQVLAQVVRAHLANNRESNAHTKNRGEVSGGGRKPFKQKGTGRARAGSSRSPLWIGGGVTFGPRNSRNYRERLNKKMSKKAMQMLLSQKIKNKKLVVVESLEFPKISTKQIRTFLEKLPIEEGRILVALAKTNANLELSANNLGYIKTVQLEGIKTLDLLKYDYLLTDKEGLVAIDARFSGKKVKKV